MTSAPALYLREGDRYVPTGAGRSGWNGTTQNGVSVAGLVAHLADRLPSAEPMLAARLTTDILGTIPMEPLVPTARIVRDGKRMQLIEIELHTEARVCVRATVLRVRSAETPALTQPPSQPFPEEGTPISGSNAWCQWVRTHGSFETPGPGGRWLRFLCPVVAGEPLAPLEALAMASDFGGGTAPLLSVEAWTLANIDVSLHVTRLPRGEWLLVDATCHSAGNGIGQANSQLSDHDGVIATAQQTVFLDRRPVPGD